MPSELEQLKKRKGVDYSFGHQQMYRGPIEMIMPDSINKPISILDIGFGIGFGFREMMYRGFFSNIKSYYFGIEPDKDSFDFVEETLFKRAPHAFTNPTNVFGMNCKVNEVRWERKNTEFDYSFCIEVIEHMTEQELHELLVILWTYTKQAVFLSTPDPQKSKEGKWQMTYLINLFRQFQFNPVLITAQWTNLWILNPINK